MFNIKDTLRSRNEKVYAFLILFFLTFILYKQSYIEEGYQLPAYTEEDIYHYNRLLELYEQKTKC
jgi:hypothetical protein